MSKHEKDIRGIETGLIDADAQVESFRQTRNNRRTELVEDYVELIADLMEDGGEARQVDIAHRLGVAQPTVAKMLKRLISEGYVQQRRYRGIFLTDAGRNLADLCRERHQIVETFLCAIGVSPETARIDAEGMEHHASAETLEAFKTSSLARVRFPIKVSCLPVSSGEQVGRATVACLVSFPVAESHPEEGTGANDRRQDHCR